MKKHNKLIYFFLILFIIINCRIPVDSDKNNNQNQDIFYISFNVNGESHKFVKGYYDSTFNIPSTNAYYVFMPESTVYDSTGTNLIRKYIESHMLISSENEVVDSTEQFITRSFGITVLESPYEYHYLIIQYQKYDTLYSTVPRQFKNEFDTSIVLNDTLIGTINDTFYLYPTKPVIEIDTTKEPLVITDISFLLKRIK